MTEIRVFPRRTSLTPTDALAFVGDPPLWRPKAERVSVSCAFTWDKAEAARLAGAWALHYDHVELGGPAYGSPCETFEPGRFIQHGVTFTSRGCNNHCPWCLVPDHEGRLRELPLVPGWIIQDNNLLQCSRDHLNRVFYMLREQRHAAEFRGGIDARLVDDWVADWLRVLRIKRVFLACDTEGALGPLREAVQRLAFLGREKLFCYVLIGRESIGYARARLEAVWRAGCFTFAQLYQPSDEWIVYGHEWRDLARTFSRPAATRAAMSAPAAGEKREGE